MAFPLFPVAYAFAELAPSILKWFDNDGMKLHKKSGGYEVASKIVDIAKKVTGLKEPQSALETLKSDPRLLLQFQQTIANYERTLTEAEYKDRSDARLRDIQMMSLGRTNLRADVMVVSAAFGLITCLVSLGTFSSDLPGEAVGIISTVAGIFGACLKDAYAFEFGSSRGSKNKDIAQITKEFA